jgi:hypothetical protein
MAGRSVLKYYWHFKLQKLCFAAPAPTSFIVQADINELDEGEWCVHVILMSKDQYKRNPAYRQEKDFIDKIAGHSTSDEGVYGLSSRYDTIKRREGITFTRYPDQIILWEIFRRDGKRICFETFSPNALEEKDAVRSRCYLPYKSTSFPFCSFRSEIKDDGWYSPRGIPEIIAGFEDSLCRQWNFKHDYMDMVNKPLFQTQDGMGNTGNITVLPGTSLPPGTTVAQMPSPPVSFDQEMQMIRALAEYRVNVPDIGATEHLAARPSGRGNVTATQINAIVGQSGLSDDMRSRVFRLDLADLFNAAWMLYKNFDSQSLTYVLYDTVGQIDPTAFDGEYEIGPNGAADAWNKPMQMQKAIARLQLLGQSPFWKRNELEKNVVEIDDPRLIKRAYQDPGSATQNQMEQQAEEISIMLLGFPAQVQASDDDKAHLQSIQGFLDRRMQENEPITPEMANLLLQHVDAHMQALNQKKDPSLNNARQVAAPMIQMLQNILQSAPPPSNVVPGPGAQQQPPMTPTDASGIKSDRISDATKVANALAALIKAGVPMNMGDINAALVNMGLPPLSQPGPGLSGVSPGAGGVPIRIPAQPDAPEAPPPPPGPPGPPMMPQQMPNQQGGMP